MKKSSAEIIREYGPFDGVEQVHGVSYDGQQIWVAAGPQLQAVDPESGQPRRKLDVPAHAGTAFDGRHLYQIDAGQIKKIDPATGQVLATIPSPDGENNSGMAWAEGSLWVADYKGCKIHRVDPETGKVLHTLQSNRFVTGVTWVDGDLWHGTWVDDASDIRRLDPASGEVLEIIEMPAGIGVSGLESNGGDRFYCGGGRSGKVRAVRRPARAKDED
jgi:glutamine cyclotransferase